MAGQTTRTPAPPDASRRRPPSPADRPATRGPRRDLRRHLRRLWLPLGIFAASRLVIYAVFPMARLLPGAGGDVSRYFGYWDSAWYLQVATQGYPTHLVPAPGQTNHAFFPLYPLLIRFGHNLTGLGALKVGIAINLLAAGLAMAVIWLLVERLLDSTAATRSVILLSFFPWAFIFSFAYSEGLLLLFSSVCLLALVEERWAIAGMAALLAGAERPDGILLALPCAWAALIAIRNRKEWKALLAPALAPWGLVAFFLYLQAHTGDLLANVHARAHGWQTSGVGLNVSAGLKSISVWIHNPGINPNYPGSVLSIGLFVVALVLMARWRPPAILWLYTVPVVVLGVIFDTFASLPRFALAAFPLLAAIARPIKGPWFTVVVAASAAFMAILFVLVGSTQFLTP